MRRRSIITLMLGAATAMTLSVACTFGTDCDFGKCEGPRVGAENPDGSTDGGADVDAAPIPEGCKPDVDPKDSPECLTDDFAVFVSPTGAPGAAGSRSAPVGTVTEALTKLIGPKGQRQRIYVCAGTYDDAPSLTASNAVPIVGGFDCKQDWKYTGAKATLAPKQAGKQAFTLDGVSGVRLVDLALNAPAGDAQNVNSIAVRALKSAASFLRVSVTAADGAAGAPADAAGPAGTHVKPADDTALSPNGNAATGGGMVGGLFKTCKCTSGGTTTGGGGGGPMSNGSPGSANPAVTPVGPADGSGGVGGMDCTIGGGGGRPGTKPPRNTDGATPTKLGELANDSWAPGTGTPGANGNPGQGGGGGGGFDATNAGGGGACGGCGGGAGKGGGGGGASIAVLSIDSTLAFLAGSELTSAKGGVGGTGGEGGAGGAGGPGGAGVCSGGAGGAGGDGGHGSGGPGGLSVLILHKGKAPTLDPATKQTVGTEGAEGPAAAGGGNPGPKGQKGAVIDVATLPQ